jgi:hypothetical protein
MIGLCKEHSISGALACAMVFNLLMVGAPAW